MPFGHEAEIDKIYTYFVQTSDFQLGDRRSKDFVINDLVEAFEAVSQYLPPKQTAQIRAKLIEIKRLFKITDSMPPQKILGSVLFALGVSAEMSGFPSPSYPSDFGEDIANHPSIYGGMTSGVIRRFIH